MATVGFPGIAGYYVCDACGGVQERVLTDSWTGKDLCFECAHIVALEVTMDPVEDQGDNLIEVLKKHDRYYEEEANAKH